MTQNKLVLIDGHALAYRVFFGLPLDAFTTKTGEPTNATFGFSRTLMDLIMDKQPPKYLAVAFDLGKTFRDDMFAEYKGTREKMPDELRTQIERIKEVVNAFNIPVLTLEGFEADDILGTIAKQAKAFKVPVHIITGDKDLLQLVDETTTVELPPSRFSSSPRVFKKDADVVKEMGVLPEQVIDLKALMGDSSDNIPGVRGVGKKTAVKLIAEYSTLDSVYDHIDEIAKRFQNKLEEGKESAYLSKDLATIRRDAPIEIDLAACETKAFNAGDVMELFRLLEFRSLTQRLANFAPEAQIGGVENSEPETITHIIRDEKALLKLAGTLEGAKEIAFDVETTGLDKQTADIVGICLAVDSPNAYYIPIGHMDSEGQAASGQMNLFATEPALAEKQLGKETVLNAIRPAMTDPNIGKIAHNAKFDFTILHRHGLTVAPITFDTMIGEWLTNPNSKHLGLKDLARHRLGIEMKPIKDLIGSGKNQRTFDTVSIEDAAPYGAADADMTLRLAKSVREDLDKMDFDDIVEMEMSLMPVLASMEQEGVGIDKTFFDTFANELKEKIGALRDEIHSLAGKPFNIGSTQQLSEVLFTDLQLPHEKLRKTKSGHFSTASDVLQGLLPNDELGIVKMILEYRELTKLKSTYVDALPKLVNPSSQRIHTSLNQTGSSTGRLASSNPNLQNIPIRSDVGILIRKGFVAKEGHVFIAADYSQVELRVLAHVSQDDALLDAFRNDQDIHRTTAASVYGKAPEDITSNERRFAKIVNFGLIYGMGAFRLARDSDLTLSEAEAYIKTYFEQFPGIKRYLDETKTNAREDGFVETILGHRRYFPVFQLPATSRNRMAEQSAEREAINYPIQGSAADIIKIAMINLERELRERGYKARMILQVHDELLIEAPINEADLVLGLLVDMMESAYALDVPLKVDANISTNWYDLK